MTRIDRLRWPVPVLLLGALACAGGGDPAAEDGDTMASIESVPPGAETGPLPAPEFVPVALPEGFPPEFPVPPESTVTNAVAQRDADGVFTSVTIMSEGDPDELFGWYREALAQAGWTISTEAETDRGRTLHAEMGESYVDLTVFPWPADAGAGWTEIEAAIWKLNP